MGVYNTRRMLQLSVYIDSRGEGLEARHMLVSVQCHFMLIVRAVQVAVFRALVLPAVAVSGGDL